jgi:LuxR family transcriptional regulator, maltose regulon positive regulatory protein
VSTNYAKLAQPRLYGPLARHRLFALIGELKDKHAVLWIASPPGSGKTTLAASYLVHAGAPAVWCQIDQGDSDPATLFFFLAQTVKDTGPALPWNLDENQNSQGRFERLFFRDFYARLPPGAVVVFDNVHEFDWNNSGALLELAFAEVPDGITVLALSRDAPPARLSRLEVSGRLATIGWNAMRLDAEETRALTATDTASNPDQQAWIALVDGWITGLVMLQNLGKQADQSFVPALQGREAVFRYFAGEIFERMPARLQQVLMLLSCLPGMSAQDAEQLTGDAAAASLLDDLYRDHLFVERRGSEVQTYHFHALFREFLQHAARQRLAAATRHSLLERAAAILESQGRIDEAAQLYQDAGAHAGLCRMLREHARDMLHSGRGQSWREWMSWLPPQFVDDDPALWYWHGVSLTEVTPVRGRQILARAEQAFLKAGLAQERLLAIAAIIDSYDFEWDDFSALPHWIAQIEQGLDALAQAERAPDFELKINSRLAIALLFAAPASARLANAAERAMAALAQVDNAVEQLTAGAILLRYFDWIDRQDMAAWLVTELSALADDAHISPFHRVKWYGRVAWWYNKDGHYRQAEQMTGSAKRIVASFELDPLLFQLLEAHHLLGTGDLPAARTLIDAIRPALSPTRTLDLIELNALEANWRSLSGDIDGAIDAATAALRMGEDKAAPAAIRGRLALFLAACHAARGDFEAARHSQQRAHSHAASFDIGLAEEAGQFIAAREAALQDKPDQAALLLRGAFERHRQRRATTLFAMVPRLASALAAFALENEVEVEHVRALIVNQRLAAPSRYAQNWPWPIAVRSLGKFEVQLDGAPLVAIGKSQQRPLTLLKALVGAGNAGKTQMRLAAQLWPAADDAKSALNVTVHRLRKLLGSDDIVSVKGGTVQLAMDKLWSDVAALGEVCERIERLDETAGAAQIGRIATELLGIYRGPFCDGGDDSWILSTREQCRNRFLSAIASLAGRLEAATQWQAASLLYQRALEAEPLAETSYRNLMRCACALGDPAAAFSVYRRCRETLSIVLGRQLSAETESLAVNLGLKQQ